MPSAIRNATPSYAPSPPPSSSSEGFMRPAGQEQPVAASRGRGRLDPAMLQNLPPEYAAALGEMAEFIDLDGDGQPDAIVPRNAMAMLQRQGAPPASAPGGGNAMAQARDNPRGWGNAPPSAGRDLSAVSHRGQMLPFVETAGGDMEFGWPQMAVQAGNAFQRFRNATDSALGGEYSPEETNPQPGDEILANFAASGGIAVPRPTGSIGAFGRMSVAEDLATPGKYANPRKAMDWGGPARLSQARTAERKGAPPEEIWEQQGWARQGEPGTPTYNATAAEQWGIKPGEWYMEYGSTPKMLGDRYPLQIGERKRIPPWKPPGEAPEAAFEADIVYSPYENFSEGDFAPARGAKQRNAMAEARGAQAPARNAMKEMAEMEDGLRAQGLSDAQIAAQINQRAGVGDNAGVTADDVRTGNVWWRVRENPDSRLWSQAEDRELLRLYGTGAPYREIASALTASTRREVTENAARNRIMRLGAADRPGRAPPPNSVRWGEIRWTERAINLLESPEVAAMNSSIAADHINSVLGTRFTPAGIRRQRARLSVTRGLDPRRALHTVVDDALSSSDRAQSAIQAGDIPGAVRIIAEETGEAADAVAKALREMLR